MTHECLFADRVVVNALVPHSFVVISYSFIAAKLLTSETKLSFEPATGTKRRPLCDS